MGVNTLFGQASLGIGSNASTATLTIGCEFEVSTTVNLTGIWWFAPPGAAGLPSACGIYSITDAAFVPGTTNSSPSWTGAGANAWNRCDYSSSGVTLVSGKKYQVCVFANGGVSANWFSSVANYWTSGPGASGITSGPLSAPSNAGSAGGQDMVASGPLSISPPTITENGKNYGVDVEVSTATAHTVTAPLTVTPSFSASRTRGKNRSAALSVVPSMSASRKRAVSRTATLPVVPVLSVTRRCAHVRSATLAVVPSFTALFAGGAAPAVQQGSWYELLAIFQQRDEEFSFWADRPPMACPRCGEPLRNAPTAGSGSSVELFCKYDGWSYPRDYDRPVAG